MFRKTLLIIAVLVLGTLFLYACNPPQEDSGPPMETGGRLKKGAKQVQPALNAMQQAFEKTKTASFSADMTLDGKPVVGKFEEKGATWRLTISEKSYFLFDGAKNKLFEVNNELKTAKEMKPSDADKVKIGTPVAALDGLDKLTWTESADKTFWDSKSADGNTSYKAYVGADGLPVKLETMAAGKVTTYEWAISNVGTVADTEFTIPADYKTTELAAPAPKEGAQAPTGEGSKEAPKAGDDKGAGTK